MSSKYLNEDTVRNILSDDGDVRAATAPYQAEFPYERDEEADVTRREFCNFLFLTSSALFAASAGFAGKLAYGSTRVEMFEPLKIEGSVGLQPGAAVNFRYPRESDTAILVRARDGNYYAYEQKCTHLTCPVYYSKTDDRLECPCHEGGFDVHTGNVLYGPPPRPLGVIEIETREGGEIWAVGRRSIEGHAPA
jgi:nitrite reductase/ring-hydroxylating ferredoxin subunit